MDNETKSILVRSENDLKLEERIAKLEKVADIELGVQQKQQFREGKPIELNVGGEPVTVGVDLQSKDGFRSLNGDMAEWDRQQRLRYDDQHPEYIGLVQTDENRWEYQKVVDNERSEEIKETTKRNSLKL